MPSTLELDSKDKLAITMGFECCWAKKHIDNVHLENSLKSIELQLKENPNLLQFTQYYSPPVDKIHWTLFWTLQALDVYTTYTGLKCEGVREINPLFPDEPDLEKIIITKGILLSPIIYLDNNYTIRNKHLIPPTVVAGLVVATNQITINKKCK